MDNKKRLLQAGLELFAKEGYDKVSIRQLADASQTNSAMISYYFGGKQGLYEAVMEQQIHALIAFPEEVAKNPQLTPPEILCLYAETMHTLHKENPLLVQLCYREFVAPSAMLEKFSGLYIKKIFLLLGSAIQQGISQKYFRDDLDIPATIILWAGMVNFFFLSRPIRSRIEPEHGLTASQYLKQSLQIFLQGIERRP